VGSAVDGPEPAKLVAEGIRVHFEGVRAVDGVDLTLEQGQIMGLIGPNGAGKTTFMNAVSSFVALTGGRVALDGVDVSPAPHQAGGPPIVVAGRKKPAMRRAARLGDGWMPFLFTPRLYAESAAFIRDEAASAGRDLTDFGWYAFIYVCVDDDPAAARRKALQFIGAGQAGDPARFEPVIDKLSATGTPEQVAQMLQRYLDAGATDLVLTLNESGTPDMAQRVMDDVLPLLSSG